MVVSAVRSAVLADRNFSSTESSGSNGPSEVQPGTPQEPYDEIMLSQGPAVHCIVMGRDSGHIHFQGGGWQPTLQSFLQERKHYSNHASSGVLSARRTPVRKQTPFSVHRLALLKQL